MHYVLSDIHGELDRFEKMLSLIHFGEGDKLFIIGDVIDRGPNGVKILRKIMKCRNVHMLLGNHEQMCLNTFANEGYDLEAQQLWDSNGGYSTRWSLLNNIDEKERRSILDFLKKLPDHLDIQVAGQRFHLVHGYPHYTRNGRIWERPEVNTPNPFPDGRTVIIGHTPVCFFTHPDNESRSRWFCSSEESTDHMRIFRAKGFIGIDCGCGNTTSMRRLACLRLEDMEEFYS